MTNSMVDLEESADVFWIQGANPGEQHPIANSQYFRQAVLEGATVIQVDPHANKTTRSFKIGETDRHMHLQVNPGADIPLLNIVLKTILNATRKSRTRAGSTRRSSTSAPRGSIT